jgi:hypothetical protein
MSDANDTRADIHARQKVEQDSSGDVQLLLRNFLDRVAMDGSRDIDALGYLGGIAASLAIPLPDKSAVYAGTAIVTGETVVKCLPGIRIVVFDIFVSMEGICNIAFVDHNGNALWGTMYGPGAGQGFVEHFPKGLWLPMGSPLAINASAAVNYSVAVNYAEIER